MYDAILQALNSIARNLAGLNPVAGAVIQLNTAESSAVLTSATIIPNDDTIPQITEGVEFLTMAIAPKYSNSTLIVEAEGSVANSIVAIVGVALFQDSTANAIKAEQVTCSLVGAPVAFKISAKITVTSTASITLRLRVGPEAASTSTVNGIGGSRRLGGVNNLFMKVTEVKA